jgi:hypothetical protein
MLKLGVSSHFFHHLALATSLPSRLLRRGKGLFA